MCDLCILYSGQPLQLTQEEIQAGVLREKRHLSVSSDKHVHVGQYTITSAYMVVCDLICARRLCT